MNTLEKMQQASEEQKKALDKMDFSNLETRILAHVAQVSTTIGLFLSGAKRLYTYQCQRPVEVGDYVNVKLPNGTICTQKVEEVHPTPQLSEKWETKWAVVVQTKAEHEAATQEASDLGKELGL